MGTGEKGTRETGKGLDHWNIGSRRVASRRVLLSHPAARWGPQKVVQHGGPTKPSKERLYSGHALQMECMFTGYILSLSKKTGIYTPTAYDKPSMHSRC